MGRQRKRAKTESPKNSSGEKLIIGLDFGTTYSGISYCFASREEAKVIAVVDWPGTGGQTVPKIPTLIKYNVHKQLESWGASVERRGDDVVGVKLFLDPSQKQPLYLSGDGFVKDIDKLPKKPVDMAADFMRSMYQHALGVIGRAVPKDYLDLCTKEFVLTVPAVWSDRAKNATQEAAKCAGISPVTLIKEPEAAALYTIKTLDFSLTKDDLFVVCDAGGGTVDLISYEVASVSPILELKEAVPGSGGMAGSLGLNRRFLEAIRSRVGDSQWHHLSKSRAIVLAETQFDREVKPFFAGDPNKKYFINFPMADLKDDKTLNLKSNCWMMTGKDVQDIYDPLISDVVGLVTDQVQATRASKPGSKITGIILVGGFGSSQYLRMRIEKSFPDIQVLQPDDAWAAIVKGAALSKIPRKAKVVSTKATRHYGVEVSHVYDSYIDEGMPTYEGRDGIVRCSRMEWYIRIGDDILRDQEIRYSFYREVDLYPYLNDLIFREKLLECSDPIPPVHPSDSESLVTNCSFTADLRSVTPNHFKVATDTRGEKYHEVYHNLVMKFSSALTTFTLEFNGESMGSVEVNFDE